ncbi:MAG: type III pantothenate kinase [Sulfurimonas sp.]|nr:type III pantothenate kinase [Sulfurimonas sp.]MDD3834694.1 type III pantothenate kinase [Sulfurimonas sp.]
MLLCDIGNTSYHFLSRYDSFKKDVKSFDASEVKHKVYYISVNKDVDASLKNLPNWIDIKTYIDKTKYYETMGVDRMMALEAVENGIIIDAGSAITVDVKRDGVFCGGFIYPGLKAMNESYKNISSALAYEFNFDIDLQMLPKNSQDAISYGYLKTLYCEVMSHKMEIILTGGDANLFAKIFKDARVDEDLVFKGMKKFIYDF